VQRDSVGQEGSEPAEVRTLRSLSGTELRREESALPGIAWQVGIRWSVSWMWESV
jgi:hypothetical protein